MEENKILKVAYGTDKTLLKLGVIEIPAYVLENGQRVLSRNGMQKALGFEGTSGDWLVNFVKNKYINSHISAGVLDAINNPLEFERSGAGGAVSKTYAHDATILIDLCDAIIEAKNAGDLKRNQLVYAKVAEIIIRAVAKVGIIALVDEATGYQYERERFELQKILNAYISDEILKWQLTFTDEFYKEVYRLWGLPFVPKYIKNKPSFIGKLTTKYIYEQLPKGVVDKIKENTGKTAKGNWKYKWHQSLTPEIGREHLKKQIIEVTTLMSVSESKEQFDALFQHKYNTSPIQLKLEFSENIEEPKYSSFNQNLNKALEYNPNKDKK